MSTICKQCKDVVTGPFEEHGCVIEASKLSRPELLSRLLASGGCTQEYYNEQMLTQSPQ
jgi:hypothetical protein